MMNGEILTPGTKRGSDELLTQTGTVNNGTVMSPHANHTDNNNDAKKVKLETRNQTNGKPSRVVHIRNIPNEVTEAEIVHLGIPFGRVTNVLVLKGKNQAFLEMHDENSATTMVAYFTNCSAQLRGRNVYVQFSNHKELKTDQSHSNANASAQAALQAAQAMAGQSETQGGPNTVLRVIIEHMVYPVTLDVLYQIFSRVGKVMKIVTFTKNNTFQALIQYPDVVTAQAAKLSLDGQNIYNACCTLRIEYSKLSSLNVKYNNDKSRDYTNPSLPTGDPALDSALALGDADYRRFRTIPYLIPQSEGGYMINPTIFDSLSFSNPTHSLTWNCCNSMSCLPTSDSHLCGGKDSLDSLIQIGSSSSIDTFNVNSGSYIYPPPGPSPNPAPGLFSSPLSIQDEWTSHNCMHKSPPRQGGGGSSFEGPNILPPCGFTGSPGAPGVLASHFAVHGLASPLTNPYGTSGAMPLAGVALPGGMTALGAAGLRLPGQSQSGCVLLISNLDEEAVTPDALFTLFGVYGDVQRVKILFNKKDSALLQMAEPHQAQLALSHLDKLKVWGKQIRVMPSKHQAVQMPKEGQPDAGLTKDYSNSSLHRFKKPGSKNYLNIYPPSSTLHLSNIPLNVDEDGIKEAFVNNGFEVKNFKFFPKDHKMALIQLESVEEAVLALVKLHNYQLSESNHLRVSFSKSTI